MYPEQISAEVLRRLLKEAAMAGGGQDSEPPRRAVITVPAYFSPNQCEATKRAGEQLTFRGRHFRRITAKFK